MLLAMALLAGLMLSVALPAVAMVWCGENGLIRFSFVAGDTLVETLTTSEPKDGVTVVDVEAWLTGVDPVALDGDAFLRVGGVELALSITGAEATVISQEFAETKVVNVGQALGQVAVGISPGARLKGGSALLVRWKVLLQGRPQNVRFGLDPTGLRSCMTTAGCPEAGSQALYVGAASANQLNFLFGAGYAPAWLNPEQEPDRTPVTGTVSWQQAGIFQAR
jgi:hypothetical protein